MVSAGPRLGPASGAGVQADDMVPVPLGFNPRWDTEFEFEVVVPELALVRFVVEDYDASSKNDFIGQSTIPLNSLKQGECLSRGGGMARCGEAGPGTSWAGVAVPGAPSPSDRNSPCLLLPVFSPARIPPCPPLVQEWRPASICHPLCEGVPPGLGLGADQALCAHLGTGQVWLLPTSRSELVARAAFRSNILSVLLRLRGPRSWSGPWVCPQVCQEQHCSPLCPLPSPRLRVFIKIIRPSAVISLPACEFSVKCARSCVPEHWHPSTPLSTSPHSHCTERAVCPPGQEGTARNKPLHGGGHGETTPRSPR